MPCTDRASHDPDRGSSLVAVDTRNEIKDFLTSRRAKISPDDVGLTSFGSRRVPGLRREEVATLAGVSVDYYNRMERGDLAGSSEGVLEAVARAARTSSPPIISGERFSPRCSIRRPPRTWPVSPISTRAPEISFPTGIGWPRNASRPCGSRSGAIRSIATWPASRSQEAFDLLASWAADGSDVPSRVITETDV